MTDFRSRNKYILSPLLETNEEDYGEDEDFKHEGRIFPTTSFMNASTRTDDQFEVLFQ